MNQWWIQSFLGTHVTYRLFTQESQWTGQICKVTLSCCVVLPRRRSTCQSWSSATGRPCSCDFLTSYNYALVKSKKPFFFFTPSFAPYLADVAWIEHEHGTFSNKIYQTLYLRGLLHIQAKISPLKTIQAYLISGVPEHMEDKESLLTLRRKAPFWCWTFLLSFLTRSL